jgi:glycosyltransferase involved in cell wall biosynthesis
MKKQSLMESKKIRVAFFQRKPRSVGNYSLEFIFEDVRKRLKHKIDSTVVYSKYESKGFFPRLYNSIEALLKQSHINHVTGDVNYIGIFLGKSRTIHTILDCVHLNTTTGLKHKVLKLFWLSLPLKKTAYVTAISESTKKEILRFINYPPEKIKVIYVAISDRFQRFDKVFNHQQPRILQIGTAPNKNIPLLIQSLKDIDCKLVIIGKYDQEYENLLRNNSIDFEYKWGLTDDQILDEYRQSDIVSLISTYEGFGMPILEAQAIGRPVITSNVFSMPEVAGDAAYLADPHDVQSIRNGFKKIIEDVTFRQSMVSKGFENVKRFDPEIIATQYYELYKQVAEKQ